MLTPIVYFQYDHLMYVFDIISNHFASTSNDRFCTFLQNSFYSIKSLKILFQRQVNSMYRTWRFPGLSRRRANPSRIANTYYWAKHQTDIKESWRFSQSTSNRPSYL